MQDVGPSRSVLLGTYDVVLSLETLLGSGLVKVINNQHTAIQGCRVSVGGVWHLEPCLLQDIDSNRTGVIAHSKYGRLFPRIGGLFLHNY